MVDSKKKKHQQFDISTPLYLLQKRKDSFRVILYYKVKHIFITKSFKPTWMYLRV